MNDTIITDELRQKLEESLVALRDDVKAGKLVLDPINQNPIPATISHHESLQTYLLLKILDTLESLTTH